MQNDLARPFQSIQRFDGCGQLHAVIRRLGLATVQGLFKLASDEQSAPTARAGIPPASAVGVYLNCLGQSGFVKFLRPVRLGLMAQPVPRQPWA